MVDLRQTSLHKNKVFDAFLNWKLNRKRTIPFPRAFSWGLGDEQIRAGSFAQAQFSLASIVFYGSQVCEQEGWGCEVLSGLQARKQHFAIEFLNAGNLHFPAWKRVRKPVLSVRFLIPKTFSLVQCFLGTHWKMMPKKLVLTALHTLLTPFVSRMQHQQKNQFQKLLHQNCYLRNTQLTYMYILCHIFIDPRHK